MKNHVFKNAAQRFDAGDFLNIFLTFFGFLGSFCYENLSYKKLLVCKQY